MKTRRATFAGQFYPADKNALYKLIEKIEKQEANKIDLSYADKKIIGGIVPHAGYEFSGYEAIHFFHNLQKTAEQPDTVVILNPDHSGVSMPVSVDNHDQWESPAGSSEVDHELAEATGLPKSQAYAREHSGEVMIPFVQYYLDKSTKILPITISQQNPENARQVAKSLVNAKNQVDRKITIIASSDFSHFVNPNQGIKFDNLVIKQINKLDTDAVYQAIRQNNISVCGFGPIMTLIEYAKQIADNPSASILARGNSGKKRPLDTEVVDYVSMIFVE
ncbi:MAG: AmmeMemoRadiSam system protein B [Bacteroidales bacterium]|nr:AmmeMemoRadiSam system protein B [Bacteroidales bacterium]MCF8327276.1 AmmeMemoRadiSam system protein B [Bacteroidales bacterium]